MVKGKEGNRSVLLLIFVLFSVFAISNAETVEVMIPDTNLEFGLRSALAKSTGAITDEDLASLTKLEAENNGISDLTGLEYCTNLTTLNLGFDSGNLISDISPLANLTKLNYLYLRYNQIKDISPLKQLTNLRELHLGNNQISDINSLSGLTNLIRLDIGYAGGNQISDISTLANLTNLEYLEIGYNQVKDLTPLIKLSNLKELHIGWNQISDISPLANLVNLRRLRVEGNKVSDVNPLMSLANLTWLYLSGNNISDIGPLSSLLNLDDLYIGSNQISDINPLSSLTNLEGLWLGSNQIGDIAPLANLGNLKSLAIDRNGIISDIRPLELLTNLTMLDLTSNRIQDLGPLANLTNLTTLFLGDNLIRDLDQLENLTNLRLLHAWNNQIADIRPLKNLTDLRALDLGGNQIEDISSLSELKELGSLSLGRNRIMDVSTLSALTNLTKLDLNNNQISELQPLVDNSGLGKGDTVEIKGNPLSDISYNTHIPALQVRGVNVVFDPRPPRPPIGISPIESQMAGTTFWIDVYAGVEDIPVPKLFGISFKFKYTNTEIIDVAPPTNESVVAGDLLGTDVIFFSTVDDNVGQVTISITRKAGAGGVEDFGTLARIRLSVSSNVSGDTSTELTIMDVQAQDPDGNRIWLSPKSLTVMVKQAGVFVWPGDTDNNGIVDERDVLPIGMYWAKTGPARSPASATWAAQTASTWTPSTATYADANGDGIVDERDVLPIGMNWHKTHEVPLGAPSLDIASIDHSQYLDAYRTLLTAFESSPKTEPVLGMAGLLREMIRQSIPKKTMVFQNYPNPFNPDTWIPFQLAEDTVVKIAIYNASGMLVRTLDLGYREAGIYIGKTRAAYWDGMNDVGENVASGVYFCRIQLGDLVTVKKIILAK